jgi:hypothetical protein
MKALVPLFQNRGMTRFEHRVHNPRHGGRNDREQRNLSLEGLGPKAFKSNMCDACFPKHFRALNNIIKYDGKTNPSIWLQDYCLTCRAGRANDDFFII